MLRPISFLLILAVAAGCATTQSIPIEDRSRTYDVAYDVAFDAVVTALAEEGYAIEEANQDQGIINTDFLVGSALDAFWLDGATRIKVNALIRDSDAGTRIVLNIALQDAEDAITGNINFTSRSLTSRRAREYYERLFMHVEAVM